MIPTWIRAVLLALLTDSTLPLSLRSMISTLAPGFKAFTFTLDLRGLPLLLAGLTFFLLF